LVLTLVGVALAVMVPAGLFWVYWEWRQHLEAMDQRGHEIVAILARLGSDDLKLESSKLQHLIDEFSEPDDVVSIEMAGPDGNVLLASRTRKEADGKTQTYRAPLRFKGATRGEARVTFSLANIRTQLVANLTLMVLWVATLVGLFTAVIGTILSRLVIRPLEATLQTFRETLEGQDLTRRISSYQVEEFDRLSQGVNQFLDNLVAFFQKLKEAYFQVSTVGDRVSIDAKRIVEGAQVQVKGMEIATSSMEEVNASAGSVAESVESLSTSAEETSSSILEMAASIDQVAGSTNTLFEAVEETTASLSEMSASITQVAAHVEQLTASAEETASAASEIDATIREVQSVARESVSLAESVTADASQLGLRSVEATVEGMRKIQEAVEATGRVIHRLGERSKEIGKILEVIDEVTDQTGLLALNAAILAAQAGEHGRGFAVVADEIKELAERTAASTQEIVSLVQGVQEEAREAVGAVQEGLQRVVEGVRLSQAAGDSLRKIVDSAHRSSEMARGIERTTREQAKGVQQVSEAMRHVSAMAEQILHATQEQKLGGEQIMRAAERMKEVTRQVRGAMAEQAKGSKQISLAVENVTAQVQVIAKATQEQKLGSAQVMTSIGQVSEIPQKNLDVSCQMEEAVGELAGRFDAFRRELASYRLTSSNLEREECLKLGVVPLHHPVEMTRRFSPLAEHLSRAVGIPFKLEVAPDYTNAMRDIWLEKTDCFFLTPTTYLEAHHRFGVQLLVKALRRGVPYNHTAIVTREGSGIEHFLDLKGRSFAFGDEKSTSSYLMPRMMLTEAGVLLPDLRRYAFLGHHDQVAQAVLSGEYDAGGLMESAAVPYKGRGLKILRESPEIPEFNICVSANIEPGLARQILDALTGLDVRQSEDAQVLQTIEKDYTGFVEARDEDYDGIRKMVRVLFGITY
jgi:phosphate/phosphite/phosphonate ABC transporter binding protein